MKRTNKVFYNVFAILSHSGQIRYKNVLLFKPIKKFYRFSIVDIY